MMMQGGWTALIWAAEKGHLGVVELLLENGAYKEAKNQVGYALFILPYSNTGQIHDVVSEIEGHCCMALVWPYMSCLARVNHHCC